MNNFGDVPIKDEENDIDSVIMERESLCIFIANK